MLKLRHLRIRIRTSGPECGADIRFGDGLNVIRADNSSGKSTCLQSIVYALGLEGMLSAKRDVPLPHAMTDSIEIDGREFRVSESWVELEIQNGRNEIITVRRAVKSTTKNQSLVEVFLGPSLTDPATAVAKRDFFVRRPGAAQRESGFHHYLERFLGWTLPYVGKLDGSEIPLYLECLFPYFFVEQKHGWSGLQARIPTYFGIRDVTRRSAEFILSLDEYSIVLQRQRLEAAASIMDTEWRQAASQAQGLAQAASIVLRGIPSRPVSEPNDINADILIPSSGNWVPVEVELGRLAEEIDRITPEDVRPVGEVAEGLDVELTNAQGQLVATNVLLSEQLQSLRSAEERRNSLNLRVERLAEDLQRHKDANLLRELGSTQGLISTAESFCPTCSQNLPDGFEITNNPMSPDESIAYIEQELRTFKAMEADFARLVQVEQTKVRRLRSESADLRSQIRSLKDALTSPSATPSVAHIMEQARLTERRETLVRVSNEIAEIETDLRTRAEQWSTNRKMLKELSTQARSDLDSAKVEFLRSMLVEQLHSYHFHSLDARSIEVSDETFRPTHEGFDLGFDLSASDMIRMIWAYLLSFLEVGMNYNTNHARLLIFDEPRQQDTRRLSFAALLRRAAEDGAKGAQIVFATSEEEDSLADMLRGLPHRLVTNPPGIKLLRPIQ